MPTYAWAPQHDWMAKLLFHRNVINTLLVLRDITLTQEPYEYITKFQMKLKINARHSDRTLMQSLPQKWNEALSTTRHMEYKLICQMVDP